MKHNDFKVSYHQFDERPLSDSCWSVQAGPDGRIYIASCIEHTDGESATVVRYNEKTKGLDYLFDLDEVTGDLKDSGRATQCKIHYSFVPDPANDMLYCATHLSGPPKGEDSYNPWAAWHDPVRAFRGSYLASYDTKNDKIKDVELFIPKEGCRCLCLDRERQLLFALTYPRDHFIVYNLKTRKLQDFGRIGSVNSQCIFLGNNGMAYTFADTGQLVRYDIDKRKLQECPLFFPHEKCQNNWHGVLYDAVKDPFQNAIYAVPWKARPHLIRFWPDEGPLGRIEDLGQLTQASDTHFPISVNIGHVGGLVFGHDGFLYYVKSVWPDKKISIGKSKRQSPGLSAILCRMNPVTLRHEEICSLTGGDGPNYYVSRGARDIEGNLYFGKIMASPSGIYRVENKNKDIIQKNNEYLRFWG
ncbi:MAG: hypothetical protein JW808_09210 [Victivallales bacterium]|nr:hypothetical protein [Victivallales bacterium]